MNVRAYLRLLRPGNCVMAGFGAAIGALCVGRLYLIPIWLAMLVVCIFTGAGNALNDYFDREIDKLNHPSRPIPSGAIRPRSAIRAAAVLFAIGLALTVFINIAALAIACLALVLFLCYELRVKRAGFLGNIVISSMVALVFIFGAVAVSAPYNALPTPRTLMVPLVLSCMAFLANIGREVIKDVEDLEGDTDRRTLPKKLGVQKANLIAFAFIVGALLLSPLPYLLRIFDLSYLVFIGIADAIFIYTGIILDKPKRAARTVKLAMALALLAFVAGSLRSLSWVAIGRLGGI